MINVAICDDEPLFLDRIEKIIIDTAKKIHTKIETYLYHDGKTIVDLICNDKEKLDILFLDIDMPGISGMEAAKRIRESGSEMIIIFISAHDQYVFESIDYSPFKYIRKSRMNIEVEIAFQQACQRIMNESCKSIIIKTDDGESIVRQSDILYFELVSRNMYIVTNDNRTRKMIGRRTIKQLYDELDEGDFTQIHSGCIVNVKYINEYTKYDITLDNGMKLIVSRSKIKGVKEAISRYWRGRV